MGLIDWIKERVTPKPKVEERGKFYVTPEESNRAGGSSAVVVVPKSVTPSQAVEYGVKTSSRGYISGGGGGGSSVKKSPSPSTTESLVSLAETKQEAGEPISKGTEQAVTRYRKKEALTPANYQSLITTGRQELFRLAGIKPTDSYAIRKRKLNQFLEKQQVEPTKEEEETLQVPRQQTTGETKARRLSFTEEFQEGIEETPTRLEELRKEKTLSAGLQRVGLGVAVSVGKGVLFAKSLAISPKETSKGIAKSFYGFAKNPITVTQKAIKEATATLKQDPLYFVGRVGGEVVVLKGTGQAIKLAGKGIEVGRTITSPKYISAKDLSVLPKGSLKKISIPAKELAKLQGKEINIASAQTSFFKPFTKEVKLERPLFFDPFGRVRQSRFIDTTREAGLRDILKGDFTLKKGKPQILYGQSLKVEKLPSTLQKPILTGKVLTAKQQKEFKSFVGKPTGLLKPVPKYPSTEPEVIYTAGEKVVRGKTFGVTLIENRRVPIIETYAKEKPISSSIRDLEIRKKVFSEPKYLSKSIQQKIVKNVSSTSPLTKPKPYLPLGRSLIAGSTRALSKPISSLTYPTKPFQKQFYGYQPRTTSPFYFKIPYKSYFALSRTSPTSPLYKQPRIASPFKQPTTPFKTPTPKATKELPILKLPKAFVEKEKELGYRTFVIRGGKKVYLGGVSPRGLALLKGEKQARQTLRATFGIEKTGFKVKPSSISYTPRMDIFRTYKIKEGRKVPLVNTFIQRKGKRLGTAGEVKNIQLAKAGRRFI